MRYLLILITIIYCQFSLAQVPQLHIVFERPFEKFSELEEELEELANKVRWLNKYNTTVYYSGNRKYKNDDFKNLKINLEFQGSFCDVCSLIDGLDLDPENSYQTNSIKSNCKYFNGIEKGKKIKKKLRKLYREKKNNNSKGILLYEAKEKPIVGFTNVPEEINTSNTCNFSIKSNSSDIVNAKIWLEKKDKYGDWDASEKQQINIKEGVNSYSLEFDSDGKICLEYSTSLDNKCLIQKRSEILDFTYVNHVGPIKLIHEENNFGNGVTSISRIDPTDIYSRSNCGAEYYILPEVGDKYFFLTERQFGIESINMEMVDLCRDGDIKRCNTQQKPIYLTLKKDPTYTSNTDYDRFIIDTWRFEDGTFSSCENYLRYTFEGEGKKTTPPREWKITLIPNLNSNSELDTKQYSSYKIRFQSCN